jgi:hypothetical protein
MPLIQFVVILAVVGVILWLVNTYIPMNSAIKGVLNVAVIIAVIIFALNTFGVLGNLSGLRIGR